MRRYRLSIVYIGVLTIIYAVIGFMTYVGAKAMNYSNPRGFAGFVIVLTILLVIFTFFQLKSYVEIDNNNVICSYISGKYELTSISYKDISRLELKLFPGQIIIFNKEGKKLIICRYINHFADFLSNLYMETQKNNTDFQINILFRKYITKISNR